MRADIELRGLGGHAGEHTGLVDDQHLCPTGPDNAIGPWLRLGRSGAW